MKKSLGLIAWRLYLTIVITLFAVAQANAQYWEMWDDDFKDIEIEKVIDNGPQENLLNIAVCAEGYTQEQLNVFKDDAIQLINELLDEQPYRNYRNFINVYLVYTPSYTSGIGSQQNTFFGATIEGERIVRLANNFYFTLKGIRFPWCQKGIILMNTSINGGSAWAGELMAFSKSQLRTVTLRHEMGHVMGHCADEYSGYDGANYERHNLTRESDPEKVPLEKLDRRKGHTRQRVGLWLQG